MSSLWIFGDSFSAPPWPAGEEEKLDYKIWTKIVCEELGCDSYKNLAQSGVSNDYIFHTLANNINNMDEGDYAIIQTTQKYRQWFFEDPTLANYSIGDLEDYISPEQAKAVEYYIRYLQNDSLDDARFIQFSLALERIVSLVNHVRMLILPGFWGAHGVNGSLVQVCDAEFVSIKDVKGFYNREGRKGKDPRCNHISPVNHPVLASKVVDFFRTGKYIDLTTGFEKGFLK